MIRPLGFAVVLGCTVIAAPAASGCLARHRTPDGVGVGTKEGEFWPRVRGEGYRRRICERSLIRVAHWVRARGGRETAFFPGGSIADIEVTGVEVRMAPAVGCGF